MASFYNALTASNYYDWLTEYNTNITSVEGKQGTNQIIGKASFVSSVTISPSSTGTTITDADVDQSNPHFAWLLPDQAEIGDPSARLNLLKETGL